MRYQPNDFTFEMIKELFHYDELTGYVSWKPRDTKWFIEGKRGKQGNANNWNSLHAGKIIKYKGKHGHIRTNLFGRVFLVHRIIWFWMTGEWPNSEVDHINGNPSDNRWVNLRDIPKRKNQQNMSLDKRNKTGVAGVFLLPNGKFLVNIKANLKTIHLGTFDSLTVAAEVRKQAERKYGFHPNHGRKKIEHAN